MKFVIRGEKPEQALPKCKLCGSEARPLGYLFFECSNSKCPLSVLEVNAGQWRTLNGPAEPEEEVREVSVEYSPYRDYVSAVGRIPGDSLPHTLFEIRGNKFCVWEAILDRLDLCLEVMDK